MAHRTYLKGGSVLGDKPASVLSDIQHQIIEWRGKPLAIRMDNGPEYVSSTPMAWASMREGITKTTPQPDKPRQNA